MGNTVSAPLANRCGRNFANATDSTRASHLVDIQTATAQVKPS